MVAGKETGVIDQITGQAETIKAGDIIVVIVSVVPFAAGWLVGFSVRAVTWIIAAVVAGYKAGRR